MILTRSQKEKGKMESSIDPFLDTTWNMSITKNSSSHLGHEALIATDPSKIPPLEELQARLT